ncbi:MAG: hemerythrin domain-containing protein [Myxococcales bacterium]|nr:hemerythrin domain-containing protein [Myxococcales bacterium]
MTHSNPTADDRPPQEQIADDHRRLRRILSTLRKSRQIDEFSPLVDELRALLRDHFAAEEAPTGLPQLVRQYAPNQLGKLDVLFDEHRAILSALDSLETQIASCKDAHERLLSQTQSLIETLESHEEQENELVSDALLVDFGGGD